jgi:hypothetical protein
MQLLDLSAQGFAQFVPREKLRLLTPENAASAYVQQHVIKHRSVGLRHSSVVKGRTERQSIVQPSSAA